MTHSDAMLLDSTKKFWAYRNDLVKRLAAENPGFEDLLQTYNIYQLEDLASGAFEL